MGDATETAASGLLRCTGGVALADDAYDSVRALVESALRAGHAVDLSASVWNALQPARRRATVWCPWNSPVAFTLKSVGFRQSYMDEAAAHADSREQCVYWEEPTIEMPHLFRLVRIEDATGVSGIGHIADGMLCHDGKVVLHWRTVHRSTGLYDSMTEMEAIHGHNGMTKVEWYPEVCRDARGRLRESTQSPHLGEAFAVPVRRALERM